MVIQGDIAAYSGCSRNKTNEYNHAVQGKSEHVGSQQPHEAERISGRSWPKHDTVKISYEARQRLHHQPRKGEAEMNVQAAVSHNTTKGGYPAAGTGAAAGDFEQYLADAPGNPADKPAADAPPSYPPNSIQAAYQQIYQTRKSLPIEEKRLDDAYAEFGGSPLLGLNASLALVPGNDSAKYEYYGLLKKYHDEVVEEMNIDLDKYMDNFGLTAEQESKDAHQAIYAKMYSDPRAVELMDILGMTETTDWGIPYNPACICSDPEAGTDGGPEPPMRSGGPSIVSPNFTAESLETNPELKKILESPDFQQRMYDKILRECREEVFKMFQEQTRDKTFAEDAEFFATIDGKMRDEIYNKMREKPGGEKLLATFGFNETIDWSDRYCRPYGDPQKIYTQASSYGHAIRQ
ncbi:MAG: hypothetical protein LBV79_01870 [Candidatus Adiutrix sp.]|jgi:hypothetical protein|nr:hypothetical protein [Candidatus Adiutrix sp.]